MRKIQNFIVASLLSVSFAPAWAEAVTPVMKSTDGEQAFYVASIFTTAPFRLCDTDQYPRDVFPSGKCWSSIPFTTEWTEPLSAQQFLSNKCPGAIVDSYEVLQWRSIGYPPKAVINFRMPPKGCPDAGATL